MDYTSYEYLKSHLVIITCDMVLNVCRDTLKNNIYIYMYMSIYHCVYCIYVCAYIKLYMCVYNIHIFFFNEMVKGTYVELSFLNSTQVIKYQYQ